MTLEEKIEAFFTAPPFAVVGASRDPNKFGSRVLACYRRFGYPALPVNPKETEILGEKCYATLEDLPEITPSISIITPPAVTESIVEEAAAAGAKHVWMQPGAQSEKAVSRAEELGLTVIHGGPCVLVELPRFAVA